ncbi:MAG TPA: DUF2917 domain-containing protein [Burkholderiales bacterium]|nr:DUF2917 domain-containing protein [Burkholderiales bacterium]
MKIELESGILRLERGQTLRVVDGAGSTICARTGNVWITEQNRPRDVVLGPGSCYELLEDGIAVVEALGQASVTLERRAA